MMLRRSLLAAGIASLLATSAAEAQTPISQFHLGPNAAATTRITFKAGRIYPMEISGTRRKISQAGSFDTDGTEDAFYCVNNTHPSCPPKADAPSYSSVLTARTGESTTLHPLAEFIVGSPPVPIAPDQWQAPAYRTDGVYTFKYQPRLSGKLVLATSETCSPPSRCSGAGFDVKIFEPEPEVETEDPCSETASKDAPVRPAAVNEVRVVAVQPDVQYHKAGTPEDAWFPACKDTVLQQGDEISCDPDGAVTLQFADNSTVVIKDTTQLKIGSFFTEGGVVRTEILLKMGQIAAQVNKSEATKSDFRIKAPTGTASVRGTDFSVFYDPGSRAMTTTVREGIVEVDPEKADLPTQTLTANQQIEVTATAMSPIAAIGKAGARGGVNRPDALARVMKVIARGNTPCGASTPRVNAFAVRNAPKGWAVSVKLVGKVKGTSKWTVKGRKVGPVNALAKKVAKRCR